MPRSIYLLVDSANSLPGPAFSSGFCLVNIFWRGGLLLEDTNA